jgi:2-oxoglutarate ferredoxin oxidoreductase subunit delta
MKKPKKPKKPKKQVQIDREWCKACSICVAFCPKGVLVLDKEGKPSWAHSENCINCGLCELRCPDVAIELV